MIQDTYSKAEKVLSTSFNDWGLALVKSESLDSVWAQVLGDPFIRRLVLRLGYIYLFIICFF